LVVFGSLRKTSKINLVLLKPKWVTPEVKSPMLHIKRFAQEALVMLK
jgi:hypothetical protein